MVAYPAIPDQYPAAEYGTAYASGLTSLMAAVAGRNSARVDIPVIGDSATEGQGATLFTNRWIAQANRAVRAAYPTTANGSGGGLGFIPIQSSGETSYTWPVTVAGNPGSFDLGPARFCTETSAATTWTFTAPAGTTSVQIMYYDAGGGFSGSFTYHKNAGSPVTVNNAGSFTDMLTASIPMTAGDVLTITWVSGTAFIDGLLHYAGDEASGITFHGCGHFGWCAGTEVNGWNQPEAFALNWAQVYANAFPALAAIGIMLGINDADVTDGNRTAAQFASDLTGLIGTVRGAAPALASVPLLLIGEYQPNIAVADAGGWAAYTSAQRGVGTAQGKSHFTDLPYRMPPGNGTAPYWADNYHPTNLGHALIGEIAAAGTRIA